MTPPLELLIGALFTIVFASLLPTCLALLMPSNVLTYSVEHQCRECGECWESEVIPATYLEPRCETEPDCPRCGGHDRDCDCADCAGRAAA